MKTNTRTNERPAKDELLESLEITVRRFVSIKLRYPLLLATAEALDRLILHLKKSSHTAIVIRNDAVYQLLLDCFDMFVIDLASLRNGLIGRTGLFNHLKKKPDDRGGRLIERFSLFCLCGTQQTLLQRCRHGWRAF
jgi:hypothetical protein